MSQSDRPDQERPGGGDVDQPAGYTQPSGVEAPTFLGADYVCTDLPTHITRARSKEQQVLLDQAYEGWEKDVAGLKAEGL